MKNTVKSAYLISCSDHYRHRLWTVDATLRELGYTTTYLTSDFDHTEKRTFSCTVPGCVQLHAKPYRKNLSVDRILSHQTFARDVFRYLDALPQEPDVIVALIPPNFLARYLAKYKKKHPAVRLIFDIFDLWPETFPSGRAKKLLAPAFWVWARIRDHSLPAADFVTTECELFRQRLGLDDSRCASVYLCAEPFYGEHLPAQLSEERLDLCYLGAINNVISIPDICSLIEKITTQKPVTLHIIGKGEREQELIAAAKSAGARVEFYGPIYDDQKKQEIMGRCHFGLNIMKASVCVGLTMKSVDYFRYGLPIINNIPADTQELVEGRGIGVQLGEDCAQKLSRLTVSACMQMRQNVSAVFNEQFSKTVIEERYRALLEKVL